MKLLLLFFVVVMVGFMVFVVYVEGLIIIGFVNFLLVYLVFVEVDKCFKEMLVKFGVNG